MARDIDNDTKEMLEQVERNLAESYPAAFDALTDPALREELREAVAKLLEETARQYAEQSALLAKWAALGERLRRPTLVQ